MRITCIYHFVSQVEMSHSLYKVNSKQTAAVDGYLYI
jgi:hypothetical protein